MIRIILFSIVLAFAVWIGLSAQSHPGFLMFAVYQWEIKMPLWLGVVALFLAYFIIHYSLKFIHSILNANKSVELYITERRKRNAKNRTTQGLLALAQGHWPRAEQQLIKAAEVSDTPLLNYLSAARAAQEQGFDKRRDQYLALAKKHTKDSDVAIGITQAQLQYHHGQYEQSLTTISALRRYANSHPIILKLLKQLYVQLKDWQELKALLPELKRHYVLQSSDLAALERTVYKELLAEANFDETPVRLKDVWETMPKVHKKDSVLVLCYANALNDHKLPLEAEAVLRAALKKNYSESLISLYGEIVTSMVAKQVAFCESLLKNNVESVPLFYALGRLSMHAKLWGKAKQYLEQCIQLSPSAKAYLALAHVHEQMDKAELSQEYYRKGLLLSEPNLQQLRDH